MTRIVEVVPSLDVGGAERMVALLARGLATLGHDVTVVSLFGQTGSWIERELAGIPLVFLGKRPGLDPAVVPRLRRALLDAVPDVVHTHLHALKYVVAAGFIGRHPAVFHTLHNLAERELERPSRILHGLAFRAGVAPVAIGEAVAESVRRTYRMPPRATIPNGIVVADFAARDGVRASIRSELGLGATPALLTVGRLNPQKNHAGLLAALARTHTEAVLLVAGDGALRPALEARAAELGLRDRVRWLGVRTDVADLLAAADLFVLASDWEGNPLVVMEAMAAGRPVVATAVGCVPELVPAEAGILVPPGDALALARALDLVLGDPARLSELGLAARRSAIARFDAVVMARAYAKLFA